MFVSVSPVATLKWNICVRCVNGMDFMKTMLVWFVTGILPEITIVWHSEPMSKSYSNKADNFNYVSMYHAVYFGIFSGYMCVPMSIQFRAWVMKQKKWEATYEAEWRKTIWIEYTNWEGSRLKA